MMPSNRLARTVGLTSTLAIAAVLCAGSAAPARAQSFQGTAAVAGGSADVQTGPNSTTVTVGSAQAVIDWLPSDTGTGGGDIDFQPAGTIATFVNDPGTTADFAVLNRIVPTDPSRAVAFNGTVLSRLETLVSGPQTTGGTVFFYSPGGIVIGASGLFDVGRLGLTTAAPAVDGNGGWYHGNTVEFQQAVSGTRVHIAAGAQISALEQGSYVAAFAPVVSQWGRIDVNGQAALVAGEAGTITFNPSGLFDIQVTIGTDGDTNAIGLDHQGTTTGEASSGPGDNHRAYLVAIPKNQLLTLLIQRGSELGFDIAGAADVEGNTVVLSAGHNIAAGEIEATPAGLAKAHLEINDGSTILPGSGIAFSSAIRGVASEGIGVGVYRHTTFASDVSLAAPEKILVGVGDAALGAGTLDIAGDLQMSLEGPGSGTVDAGLGSIAVLAGGTMNLAGNLTITATATSDGNEDGLTAGGTIGVQALGAGSRLTVGGEIFFNASADSFSSPPAAGGTIAVQADTGGAIDLQNLEAWAYGVGGSAQGDGGAGQGGLVNVFATAASSSISIADDVYVTVDGIGGASMGGGGNGGNGTGGLAQIEAGTGGGTVTVGGTSFLTALGLGGSPGGIGASGGAGQGGTAQLRVLPGGVMTLTGEVSLNAPGIGGGDLLAGVTGGAGIGGFAGVVLPSSLVTTVMTVDGTDNPFLAGALDGTTAPGGDSAPAQSPTLALTGFDPTQPITVSASGGFSNFGGTPEPSADGSPGSFSMDPGQNGISGPQNVQLNGLVGVFLDASVPSGAPPAQRSDPIDYSIISPAVRQIFWIGDGLTGTGSGAQQTIFAPADATRLYLGAADGFGWNNNSGVSTVTFTYAPLGGSGPRTLNLGGGLVATAGGFGGSGAIAGAGTGGQAQLGTFANGTINVTGDVRLTAQGDGGSSFLPGGGGIGGRGLGGLADIFATGGLISISGSTVIDAWGIGGDAGTRGGEGQGGQAALSATAGGTLEVIGSITTFADGFGGDGQTGGAGIGHNSFISALGGDIVGGDTYVSADGLGGASTGDGPGGDASGGVARILSGNTPESAGGPAVDPSTVELTSAAVTAAAFGGNGAVGSSTSAGGSAAGGSAFVLAGARAKIGVEGNVHLIADGIGGHGQAAGGAGTAGTAKVEAYGGELSGGQSGGGGPTTIFWADLNQQSANEVRGIISLPTGPVNVTYSGPYGFAQTSGGTYYWGGDAYTIGGVNHAPPDSDIVALDPGGPKNIAFDQTVSDVYLALISWNGNSGTFDQPFELVSTGNGHYGSGTFVTSGPPPHTSFTGTGEPHGIIRFTGSFDNVSFTDQSEFWHGIQIGIANIAAAPGAALLGGAISFGEFLTVDAIGRGGEGATAGHGFGGNALVRAPGGTITGGQANLHASGSGGNSLAAGAGGNGTGGLAWILAGNTSDDLMGGPAIGTDGVSKVDLTSAFVTAAGLGGDGGTGSATVAGGIGGSAIGGRASVTATAGNGTLRIDTLDVTARADGGRGGDGAFVSTGAGGDAGSGGSAVAGNVTFGTQSGVPIATNTGSASFGAVAADSSAAGGDGGDGGSGLSDGRGGAGGAATGALAILLSRGSPVEADTVHIAADALGGAGGSGLSIGAGGAATAGSARIIVSNRFERTERGSATVGTLLVGANATGGAGSTTGVATLGDGVFLDVQNGDATLGSATLHASGAAISPTALPSTINILNGTINVSGTLELITSGAVTLQLDNATLNVGDLVIDAADFVLPGAVPAIAGNIVATGQVALASDADILTYANITANALRPIAFAHPGSFQSGALTLANPLSIAVSDGFIRTGGIQAGPVTLSASQSLTTGTIGSSGSIDLAAGQALATGNVIANGSVEMDAAASLLTGNITSGQALRLFGGTVGTGNLTAGFAPASQFSIGIAASGAIAAGNLVASRDIGILSSTGPVATGNITTGTSVGVLSGGSVSLGAVATGTAGNLYIAHASMASLGGPLGPSFNSAAIFSAAPVAAPGAITISGPVSTGRFTAATAQALSAAAINATTSLRVFAGGLASAGGLWRSPLLAVRSGDIAIAQTGGLEGDSIELVSTSGTQALIGDGLTGTGYALSSAEFGRISAGGSLRVLARDNPGSAADMLIGDLALTGPDAGSTIENPDGTIVFATGNIDTLAPSGTIRIVGDVLGSGFRPGNYIEFYSDLFELDAATGSLSVAAAAAGSGAAPLGGTVLIEAAHIHVAEEGILAKLRQDPLYAGRETDLNSPASIQRPEGVLRAHGLELYPGATLYIQNTGTAQVPAGFFTTIEGSDIEPPEQPVAGGVNVIINGAFAAPDGPVTGAAAHALLRENAESLEGFSAISQINACAISAASCGGGDADPIAELSSQFDLLSQDTLEEEPFADESEEDEESEADEGEGPIAPPAPLIDTRPLNPAVTVVEPVAGSGNPALIGSAVDETAAKGVQP